MKVELKNFKEFKELSDENTCFVANIYIDGKKAGRAENRGRGGMTLVLMESPELKSQLETSAKEYLKNVPNSENIPSEYFAEYFVDDLVDNLLKENEDKNLQKTAEKKKAHFLKQGFSVTVEIRAADQVIWFGMRDINNVDRAVKDVAEKHHVKEYSHRVV
jgi:hypothetical protein